MYNKIASYYDELGWAENAKLESDIINNILIDNNIVPDSMCDFGCGTGELIKLMNDVHDDIVYIGVDISDDMISVAKKKFNSNAKNVKFITKDMRTFKLEKRVDLITCMFDTINHLLRKEHWQETFNNAYESLKYGGAFVFDVVPKGGLKKWECTSINENKIGLVIKKSELDKKTNILTTNINAFVKTNYFGTYRNIKEDVRETSFELKEIIKMVKDAGFKKIKVYDENYEKKKLFGKNFNEATKIYISALK